jgi:hypothetical protein
MSVKYAEEVYASDLGHSEKSLAVYIALTVLDDEAVAKRRKKNPQCTDRPRVFWESARKIADDMGLRPQAVYLLLAKLVALNILIVLQHGGGRKRFGKRVGGLATTYEFHPEALVPRRVEAPKEATVAGARPTPESEPVAARTYTESGQFPSGPHTESGPFTPATYTESGGLYRNKELSGKQSAIEGFMPSSFAFAPADVASPTVSGIERKGPDRPSEPSGAIDRCIGAFQRTFVQRFDVAPLVPPVKAGKIFRPMVDAWGEGVVLDLVATFFETSDRAVRASDYSIGAFGLHAGRLLIQQQQPPVDPTTQANIDAMTRAMRPRSAQIGPLSTEQEEAWPRK